jgi:hypothetical protein
LARAGGAQTLSIAGGKIAAGGVGNTSDPASVTLAQIAQKSSLSGRAGPAGLSADPDLMLVKTASLASAEESRNLSPWAWPNDRTSCNASAKNARHAVGRVWRRNQRIRLRHYVRHCHDYHVARLDERVRKGKYLSRAPLRYLDSVAIWPRPSAFRLCTVQILA